MATAFPRFVPSRVEPHGIPEAYARLFGQVSHPKPDERLMPAKCERPGLHFQYPENWALDDEAMQSQGESVTVYSPSGAFWSVARYPRSADPAQLARAAVDAMRQEYDSLESHEASDAVGGHSLIGYDLFFYCLDLTNTAQVRATTINESTYVVFQQAEDRDFERFEPVFRAILTSLLRGIKELRADI